MDLDIKRVLAARPPEPEQVSLNPLTTPWGDTLDPGQVLQEYPRPQMERDEWTCLNGWWDYAIVESSCAEELWSCAAAPECWDGRILVPFSPEAALSGVRRQLTPKQLLWYRREVIVDKPLEEQRLLLHFGAVDYACACLVNGVRVGTHTGGYLPFSLDISEAVQPGANRIELCVWDPSETGTQLRGKQRLRRGNMWYTAQSGIWQTVWLERLPARHVTSLVLDPRPDAQALMLDVQVSEVGDPLEVELLDAQGNVVAKECQPVITGQTTNLSFSVPDVHLWSPDDPYLYGLRVCYGADKLRSYCAFRTVSVEPDEQGVARFCLNHEPFFVKGLLDQGYWPDGLMTAPAEEALLADIQAARDAGFNMLRKHIKVEQERWYWLCDKMGMLVWQDMVSGGGIPEEWTSANIPTLVRRSWHTRRDLSPRSWKRYGAGDKSYREEWRAASQDTVRQLANHPCIATWVVFNESWGQFLSRECTELLREVDNTRPYIATSGWYDQGAGDYFAVHNYFRGMRVYKDPHARLGKPSARAFLIDEFGGLTCPVEGHLSVDTTYGYDTYEDTASWREGFRSLIAEVDALEAQGLSGYVYTQVSDVEEETNGLLTYDRRVNKLTADEPAD